MIALPSSDEVPLLLPDSEDSSEKRAVQQKPVFRIEKVSPATVTPAKALKKSKTKPKSDIQTELPILAKKRAHTMLTESSTIGEQTPATAPSLAKSKKVRLSDKLRITEQVQTIEVIHTGTLPVIFRPIFKFLRVAHTQ